VVITPLQPELALLIAGEGPHRPQFVSGAQQKIEWRLLDKERDLRALLSAPLRDLNIPSLQAQETLYQAPKLWSLSLSKEADLICLRLSKERMWRDRFKELRTPSQRVACLIPLKVPPASLQKQALQGQICSRL